MNDLTTKAVVALEMLSNLKNVGILNSATIKLWIADYLSEDFKYNKILNNAILITKKLTSPFNKPDLSVDGPIRFAISENNIPIGINPEECHVLISGSTGTGKSTLLRLIFAQAIAQGIQIWLFVRAKDMRGLLSYMRDVLVITFNEHDKINPLNPIGIPEQDYCNVFSDNFIQTFGLYDGTQNFILENLNNLYKKHDANGTYPSIHDLYYFIKAQKYPQFSRTAHYQESALNRLSGMIYGTLGKVFDCSIGYEQALFENNCIFEIDNLTSNQQRFIVNLLLTNLFYHRNQTNQNIWMFVGIDDAALIMDRSLENRADQGLPIIFHLITTVRKSKINVFCCSQAPNQLASSIHSNSFVKIMFLLSNGKDIECMQQSMGIKDPEQKEYCYKLKPREAIIKFSGRYQEPFLARIPEVLL